MGKWKKRAAKTAAALGAAGLLAYAVANYKHSKMQEKVKARRDRLATIRKAAIEQDEPFFPDMSGLGAEEKEKGPKKEKKKKGWSTKQKAIATAAALGAMALGSAAGVKYQKDKTKPIPVRPGAFEVSPEGPEEGFEVVASHLGPASGSWGSLERPQRGEGGKGAQATTHAIAKGLIEAVPHSTRIAKRVAKTAHPEEETPQTERLHKQMKRLRLTGEQRGAQHLKEVLPEKVLNSAAFHRAILQAKRLIARQPAEVKEKLHQGGQGFHRTLRGGKVGAKLQKAGIALAAAVPLVVGAYALNNKYGLSDKMASSLSKGGESFEKFAKKGITSAAAKMPDSVGDKMREGVVPGDDIVSKGHRKLLKTKLGRKFLQ